MTYKKRLSLLILLDSLIVLGSIYISYFILTPYFSIYTSTTLVISSIALFITHHAFAHYYRLYKKAWEYASIGELTSIFKSVTMSIALTALVQFLLIHDIYYRTLVITWMMHMLFIGGTRFSWRVYRDTYFNKKKDQKRTLIIGAGAAGTMVARQMKHGHDSELYPIAFVDDDVKKHKLEIMGIPVLGGKEAIETIVEQRRIEHIIIAIPSLKTSDLQDIYKECAKTKVKTQTIPKIEDIMVGKVSVNAFKDVQVEDLLGREPVQLDNDGISESITGKTVLVTGAGGSIGSEICRQICKFTPDRVVLVGHGENSIYAIDMELNKEYGKEMDIIPVIADIQDRDRMFEVMNTHRPDVVYHAAAHKHVPLMEYNPREAVKNNVFGTKNVAEAAETFEVNTFVLVSSDKAVNPPNIMGATKRVAEMIIQHLDKTSKTRFVAVRFGNVLGSRGSVIPLFKKQIQAGGPVTVTHPEMTRYFMTIPEASRLVIQAGVLAQGGEIFVLDMGEPVKIVDLAENLIKLSGYTVEEIGVQFSGIRPGEKMYEELLNDNEIHSKQVFPKIHVGKAAQVEQSTITSLLDGFDQLTTDNLKQMLLELANKKYREDSVKLEA